MNFGDAQQRIIDILNLKVKGICPFCGNGHKTILPGFSMQGIQDEPKGVVLGGKSVPAVGTACTNCGNIQFFAAKILLPDLFKDESI